MDPRKAPNIGSISNSIQVKNAKPVEPQRVKGSLKVTVLNNRILYILFSFVTDSNGVKDAGA